QPRWHRRTHVAWAGMNDPVALSPVRAGARTLWVPLAAVGSALGLAAVALAGGGYDTGAAAAALWRGAFGSPAVVPSVTLVRAIPLVLTGLAVALALRAGVWNIGAEGQLYAGAMAGIW